MPVIVGVDPGVQPTLCVLIADKGRPLAIEIHEGEETCVGLKVGKRQTHRPSAPMLRQALRQSMADLVVIEDVGAMPGNGVAGMFAFGFASGMIEGVAVALGQRVMRVTPIVWHKAFRLNKGSSKAMSRHIAMQLAPHLADQFKLAKHHNRAEAFLIAYWGLAHARDAAA